MLFCPKCKNIMLPKENEGKHSLFCGCGYASKESEDILISEQMEKKKKVEVLDDKDMTTLPKTKEDCPKCKHTMAYFWTVQTRAGDEAETRFFQCMKCDHRWRVYD